MSDAGELRTFAPEGRFLQEDRCLAAGTRLVPAPRAIQTMMLVFVLLMVCLPPGLLDKLGYDYGTRFGSVITRIHPSAYWAFLVLTALATTFPSRTDLMRFLLSQRLGTIFFAATGLMIVLTALAGHREGKSSFFDTMPGVLACVLVLPLMPDAALRKWERLLHVVFFCNAVLAIGEYELNHNLFPQADYENGGILPDSRATALFGHPLTNAALSGTYAVSLLWGGAGQLSNIQRLVCYLFQSLALVAFGGRTGFVVTIAMSLIWLFMRCVQFLRGRKVAFDALLLVSLAIAGLIALDYALYRAQYFNVILDRFIADGGSAEARVNTLRMLGDLPVLDMLWGADADVIKALQLSYHLQWGLENPYLSLALHHGLVAAALVIIGYGLVLREVWRDLRPAALAPIICFMTVCSSYESFGTRLYQFSLFLVTIYVLYRRGNDRLPPRLMASGLP